MINQPEYEVTLEPKIRTQPFQDISLETYEQLITDKEIAERIIKDLRLDQPPYEMNFLNLNKMLSLNLINNTNLIQMKITSGNPELAQSIVNLWAELFVEKNKNVFQQGNKRTAEFIEDQLAEAEYELTKTEEEIRQFDSTNQIDILQKEIEEINNNIIQNQNRINKLKISITMEKNKVTRLWQQLVQSRLVYYQSRKANLKMTTDQKESQFTKIKDLLSGLEEKIVLSKSIVEDPYIQRLFQELLGEDPVSLYKLKLSNEEINPIYVQLTEYSNQLETDIVNYKKEIEVVDSILVFLTEEIAEIDKFFQQDAEAIDSKELINKINDSLLRISENDGNIGNEYQSIFSSIETIKSIENEIKELDNSINEVRKKVVSLKDDLANQRLTKTRLERKYDKENNIHDILTQKNEEIKIALSAESANLEVAKYAHQPQSPIKPNKKLNIAIAGVLGLFMGIFIAFFAEFWQSGKQ